SGYGEKSNSAAIFVMKMNTPGDGFIFKSYVGGSGQDLSRAIAVDENGNVYVAGSTSSTNFPAINAIQKGNGGGTDAFVVKMGAAGNELLYSTYLGGNLDDRGNGVAIDAAGNAFVTGTTASINFPTVNALQGANGGETDAFVTKLSASGNELLY